MWLDQGALRYEPETDSLVLATCSKVTSFMWIPAKPEALGLMAKELHLWVDVACRHAGMFRPIPDHHSPICAHSRNDVGILRLIPGLVHFAFMVNLLNNIELDFHLAFFRSSAIAANLASLFIIVLGIRCIVVRQLYMGNLQVVLSVTGSMGTDQKAMRGIRLIGNPTKRLVHMEQVNSSEAALTPACLATTA